MRAKLFNPIVLVKRLSNKVICELTHNRRKHNVSFKKPKSAKSNTAKKWKWGCYFCKLKFLSETKLSRHMTTHTGERRNKCSLCNKTFIRQNKRNEHLNSVHKSDGYFKCQESNCVCKFTNSSRLIQHLITHRAERPFACTVPLCLKTFRRKNDLNYHHKSTHNNEKNYGCKFCPNKFSTRSGASLHMKRIHLGEKDLTKCPHKKCQLVFQTKRLAYKHAIQCQFRNPDVNFGFSCELCPKVFLYKYQFLIHMKVHSGERNFSCGRLGCAKTFIFEYDLKRHENEHRNKDSGIKLKCDGCKKSFETRQGLRKHGCPSRPGSIRERIICYFCGSSLSAALTSISGHLRLHTGEKPFKCANNPCKSAFISIHGVRYHGIKCVHGDSSEVKYKCKLCQRPFSRLDHLEGHMAAVHTGERAFRCDRAGCGKTFACRVGLRGHLRLHLDRESGRSFPCDRCGKVYKTASSLRGHLHSTHGKWSGGIACYFCGKKLTSSMSTLRRHLMIHTKEVPFKCHTCRTKFKSNWEFRIHRTRKH